MSFDKYLEEQLKNPKFAASYWKERHAIVREVAEELEARVADLEEQLKWMAEDHDYLTKRLKEAGWEP